MRRVLIFLWFLVIGIPNYKGLIFSTADSIYLSLIHTADKLMINPMEALDLVKEEYATNFNKISLQENRGDYFYKLEIADYYLVYEDTDDITGNYLFHLYEFVLDDIDTGIGHTVTYGWYWVNPNTGVIVEYP